MLEKQELGILPLLTAGKQLDAETWVKMIEARVEMIKPCLDRFTLSTVGKLYLDGPDPDHETMAMHELYMDMPKVVPSDYSLDTQGLFSDMGMKECEETPEHSRTSAYGLTRNGNWVILTIYCDYLGLKQRVSGRSRVDAIYQDVPSFRAREVSVHVSSPQEICATGFGTYKDMFMFMNGAVREWLGRAETAYNKARELTTILDIEYRLVEQLAKS